jgi:recombination protein RecR
MYPDLIKKLIASFAELPGVGERAATRYVFHFLKSKEKDVKEAAKSLAKLKEEIALCSECYNIAQKSKTTLPTLCPICKDKKRRKEKICLVEKISDIERINSMGFYDGIYHVLGGLINPPKGTTASKITLKRLIARLKKLQKEKKEPELIMALNPTREGDLTVNHIKELIAPLNIKTTRLARGIPTGGELQYADEDTLRESFSQRKKL